MKLATLTLLLLFNCTQMASDQNLGKGRQMVLTLEQVQPIVQRYVDKWKVSNPQYPLWVSLASPGDAISVPGVSPTTLPLLDDGR